LSLSRGAGPETVAEANRIYVFERLPHHLIALNLAPGFLTRQLVLQGAWLLIVTLVAASTGGHRAMRWCVAATIAVCWMGLLLTMLLQSRPDVLAALMRYYWFRASDVFVPIGVSLELCQVIAVLGRGRLAAARGWLAGAIAFSAIDTTNQFSHLPFPIPYIRETLPTPRADKNVKYDDWRAVCDWIVEHTDPGDRILAPRSAATLKWYTGRPEVANWKDVPQDAASIVEWWRRMQELHGTGDPAARWYASFSEQGAERLAAVMEAYRAEYVVVPLKEDLEPLPVEPLFQNTSYAVYRQEQLAR
jgi:hypothetical protein